MHNSVERFNQTVEFYQKYRPRYPQAVIEILANDCQLNPNSIIADIGSGTGIFTQQLLNNGNKVYAIEPNASMRDVAEKTLAIYPNFNSIAATAEDTSLPDQSIDFITAAQAFHWFNQARVKPEFQRILKPGGWLVLLWNLRMSEASGFMQDYEKLLQKYGTDYVKVAAENIHDPTIEAFFNPNTVTIKHLPNQQIFDWDSLRGRIMSTSYVPKPDDPRFEPMMAEAKKIFLASQINNKIEFIYQTKIYFGHLN